MRITKFGHACVRIEHDGRVVVVDPGCWTDPRRVDGADAVLVTHEHPDHFDPDRLRATDAPVFTIEAVGGRLREDAPDVAERVTVVAPGRGVRRRPAGARGRRAARRDPPRAPAGLQQRVRRHGR